MHNIVTYHINGGGTKKSLAKRGPGCFHGRNNGKDQPLKLVAERNYALVFQMNYRIGRKPMQ